jgi:hypothetical protein
VVIDAELDRETTVRPPITAVGRGIEPLDEDMINMEFN